AVVASLAHAQPLVLLLLVLPTNVVYRSLRYSTQLLQLQTASTVQALADAVDRRDEHTFDHSRRVAEMARDVARRMNLSPAAQQVVSLAAPVHDVGKAGINNLLSQKPGALTPSEWLEVKTHPEVGARLVENLSEFRKGRELILAHHERFDGKGYPNQLAGHAI